MSRLLLLRCRNLLPYLSTRARVRPLCSSSTARPGDPFAPSSTVSASEPSSAVSSSAASASAADPNLDPAAPAAEAYPHLDAAAAAAAAAPRVKKPWSFLKFAIYGALFGTIGTAGYVTYAYTLDEVNQKTTALRTMSNHSVVDDASGLDKYKALVYSSTIKIPAKMVELYMDLRKAIEEQVRDYAEPDSEKLLPDLLPQEQHVFTLVLDLNETLVHSDWKRDRGWRTFKRPGVDAFLEHMAKLYEVVVYTDQLGMYADPVLERLDQKGCIRFRLSRTATKYINGKHYRDLSKLNRNPSQILYISGNALESSLQPENSVPIKPWKLETDDTVLLDLIPFLEYVALHRPADIRPVLASYQGQDIPSEFIERSKEHQRRMQQQKHHRGFWRS